MYESLPTITKVNDLLFAISDTGHTTAILNNFVFIHRKHVDFEVWIVRSLLGPC